MTDHYVLATATPHKGDPENFRLFLSLLDKDVYGDVSSLEEAMKNRAAPFYLRRVKEALVTFPDPDTGQVKLLFTKRIVRTTEFELSPDEWDFYNTLTGYVEDQSIKAAADDSATGRVVGFTMAMLQRRFASSSYAARRSLERMKEKREKILADPKVKLLVFTEHKDTLDYLAGDGKGGRPLGKLRQWGLSITEIYGGMKIGDRNTAGTRLYTEREFKEDCQVMVATEAAGEGINLQFCWLTINYDIPWNPMRLGQRMGRTHRYGQEKDCLIFNFVSTNTREGRVLQKLFERIRQIEVDLDPKQTGKVFNVLGDVFPANGLERMLRDMYAHNNIGVQITLSRKD
jgi:SNF2 family DNA or RNA helicase